MEHNKKGKPIHDLLVSAWDEEDDSAEEEDDVEFGQPTPGLDKPVQPIQHEAITTSQYNEKEERRDY
jgi:hypothetical protein